MFRTKTKRHTFVVYIYITIIAGLTSTSTPAKKIKNRIFFILISEFDMIPPHPPGLKISTWALIQQNMVFTKLNKYILQK